MSRSAVGADLMTGEARPLPPAVTVEEEICPHGRDTCVIQGLEA